MKKISNNVSPIMHKEVENNVMDGNNNRSQVVNAQLEFVISKRLLAGLPIVPTSERVFELAQDIQSGLFSDLGDISTCEQNWNEWLNRTSELLKARGILVLSRLKKKNIRTASQGDPVYFILNGKKAWAYNDPGAQVKFENGDEAYCPDCGTSIGFAGIDEGKAILECDCGNTIWAEIIKGK